MNDNLLEIHLNEITEDETREAVKELIEFRKTGFLPNGIVRTLATRVAMRANLELVVGREQVTRHVLYKAASLWAHGGETPAKAKGRPRTMKAQPAVSATH